MFNINNALDRYITGDSYDIGYKKICNDEDVNPITDPQDAVYALIEELYEGNGFNSLRVSNALQCLAKIHKADISDIDADHPNVISQNTLATVKSQAALQIVDMKKAVRRHLQMLKYELYGEEEIDHKTVNGAVSNLEWIVDQNVSENKKLTIKRG